MPFRHVLLALLIVAIWGFNFVVIKLSVHALPPILAAGLRFFFVAVPAIFLVRPPKSDWPKIALFGLTFGFALYTLLNLSLRAGLPAGLASVVLQVQAFFTMALAMLVFAERPRLMQWVGAGIAFSGIAVIGSERWEGAQLWPFAITILAAFSWGVANVTAKSARRVNPIVLMIWGSFFAAIPLLGLSLMTEGSDALIGFFTQPDWQVWAIIAFLAYPASLFGAGMWNWLLSLHPASTVAPFTLLVPITGLLSGWLVLHETVTPIEVVGGALVVVGLGVTVVRRRGKRVPVNRAAPEV